MTASVAVAGEGRASPRQAALLLIVAVVAWGLTWPFNKIILASLPPLTMSAIRSAIATVALFAIALAGGKLKLPGRGDVPIVLSIALLHMVGFVVTTTVGLQFVPAGRSVVLAYTTPLWITPGASLFLGEPLTARRAAGVALGLIGLAVLFNPLAFDWGDGAAVFGNLIILLGALLWALSILHIRGHRWRATPFELLPWEMLLATVVLAVLAVAFETVRPVEWTAELILLLLYAGLPAGALGYWAAAVASRSLPAVTTSLGMLGAPLVGILGSMAALGEMPGLSLVIAVTLILGGVAVGTTTGGLPRRAADK
jgi:drug/metabolite transporter (DMT)-like permease